MDKAQLVIQVKHTGENATGILTPKIIKSRDKPSLLLKLLKQFYPVGYELHLRKQWKEKFQQKVRFPIYFSRPTDEVTLRKLGNSSYCANMIDAHHISRNTEIFIGNYTSIGQNLKLISSGGHSYHSISNYPFFGDRVYEMGDITIGNDVWIGDDVTIMGGVNIPDGCVIGAGSIVTQDLESFGIYAGVPARFIKFRFSKDVRDALSEIQWWNLTEEAVRAIKGLLNSSPNDNILNILYRFKNEYFDGNADSPISTISAGKKSFHTTEQSDKMC